MRASAFCSVVTAFLVLFGYVYDLNGLGQHSHYMSYAFVITLVMCVIPYSLLALLKRPPRSRLGFNLYNSGVALLVVFSLFRGVIRIAGIKAGSRFELPLFIAGAAFAAAGLTAFIIDLVRNKKAVR